MQTLNPARILYQDDHILAVNKLSRELVVRGKGRMDKSPLLDFLRGQFGKGLKAIHRLDFETSGVVLFAKTNVCFDQAVTQKKFVGEDTGVKKVYRAIVMGVMQKKSGVIDTKLPARNKEDLLPAKTSYRVLQVFGDTSYVEAEISSGRHHQIRRHFAGIGHPLVNDEVYGNKKFNHLFAKTFGYRYFFLHAYSIECDHFVTGQKLKIVAEMPRSFEEALQVLNGRQ